MEIYSTQQILALQYVVNADLRKIVDDVVHGEESGGTAVAATTMEMQPRILGKSTIKRYKLIDFLISRSDMVGRGEALVADA